MSIPTPARILVVEDIASLAMTYAAHLEGAGHIVDTAERGDVARTLISAAMANGKPYDVVLLDLQLPDCDGLEWLVGMPGLVSQSGVIVITADGSIKRAIAAMRMGTYDFLVKPLQPERLLTTVRNAIERRRLEMEVQTVRNRQLSQRPGPCNGRRGIAVERHRRRDLVPGLWGPACRTLRCAVPGDHGELSDGGIAVAARRIAHP